MLIRGMLVQQTNSKSRVVEKPPDASTAIFDSVTDTVHALDFSAAAALEACQEPITLSALTDAMRQSLGKAVTEETVLEAVSELQRAGLVTVSGDREELIDTSRRNLLKSCRHRPASGSVADGRGRARLRRRSGVYTDDDLDYDQYHHQHHEHHEHDNHNNNHDHDNTGAGWAGARHLRRAHLRHRRILRRSRGFASYGGAGTGDARNHAAEFRKQLAAGVEFAMGSDVGPFPHGTQAREFVLMVKYGMSPLAAIQAGTLHGAKLLGWEGQIGALKAGYFADVIAVEGNPLENIGALEKVSFVMKGRRGVEEVVRRQESGARITESCLLSPDFCFPTSDF